LLSGGLDSILAVKLLQEQGIKVEAVNFRTNFCGPSKARPAAEALGVPLREVNIREDFLGVLKKPKHGYGAGLNPCIDCHALMLKKAGETMRAEGFDFVATGEVLGERPMSQHKQALDIVARDADVVGYLLRPLSARLLEPTIAEQEGLINREQLLDISGRSRKRQMMLAAQYGLRDYPTPAGGCALTQEGFAARLKELMKNKPDFTPEDADLVAFGRHFWLASPRPEDEGTLDATQIILGRNKEENELLKNQIKAGDVFVVPVNFPGPEALIRGKDISEKIIARAQELIIQFSSKAKNLAVNRLTFKIFSDNK